jgi:arsenate reductase
MSVKIDFLVTPDCPHAEAAEGLVRRTLERIAPNAEFTRTVVRDSVEAEQLAFPGSPTVRVDGEDLAGSNPGPPAYSCRTYDDGKGVPPEWLIEAKILRALQPRHLLFLCVANSARSQMAEGIARSLAPVDVRISSAGSEPSRVNPFAVLALEELGIDPSTQRSKGMDEIRRAPGPPVDAVITLCAEEVCPAWLGKAHRLHWPFADPAAASGSDEKMLASFRRVRDGLRQRLAVLFL